MGSRSGNGFQAAVIVAHPDDEVIWCGGLIGQHPQWDWTVLSLCRADDPDRAPKFQKICRLLGVAGAICDLDDSNPPKPIHAPREIGRRIAERLGDVPWDLCLTHGANGEYGHPRHVQVHSTVLSLVADGILECLELWTFAYECDAVSGRCRPADGANVLVKLTRKELAEKTRLVRDVYGYPSRTLEVRACISPESFLTQPTIRGNAP